jgi:YedE family putative selenium metabolism protein
LLKSESSSKKTTFAILLLALVGAAAAALVIAGNPGNMGVCGACFLRDWAGALGLSGGKGPACFRPELVGIVLGALLWKLLRKDFVARSGSYAGPRFFLGLWMGLGALVFLGCPFRLLQRLGGGDLNAWVALPGFVLGVGAALILEKRGYSVGKTSPAPAPVGLLGPLLAVGLLALFLTGGILLGPGPGDPEKPPHAPWALALGLSLPVGIVLSATGFCAISAARRVFQPAKAMLGAALALIVGYAAVLLLTGRFHPGFSGQPAAHADHLWSFLAISLVGFCGALAGGCPVRQTVMAGEGNGDALVTAAGILAGGALAHTLGTAAVAATTEAAGGVPLAGKAAVSAGWLLCALYGWSMTRLAA